MTINRAPLRDLARAPLSVRHEALDRSVEAQIRQDATRTWSIPIMPPHDGGQNAHVGHWSAKRANENYRKGVADWLAKCSDPPVPAVPIEHCAVFVVAYFCRKRPARDAPEQLRFKATRRAKDIQNLAGDTKPLLDAFQPFRKVEPREITRNGKTTVTTGALLWGAGIIRADDREHMRVAAWEFGDEVATFGEERIEVTVVDLDKLAAAGVALN